MTHPEREAKIIPNSWDAGKELCHLANVIGKQPNYINDTYPGLSDEERENDLLALRTQADDRYLTPSVMLFEGKKWRLNRPLMVLGINPGLKPEDCKIRIVNYEGAPIFNRDGSVNEKLFSPAGVSDKELTKRMFDSENNENDRDSFFTTTSAGGEESDTLGRDINKRLELLTLQLRKGLKENLSVEITDEMLLLCYYDFASEDPNRILPLPDNFPDTEANNTLIKKLSREARSQLLNDLYIEDADGNQIDDKNPKIGREKKMERVWELVDENWDGRNIYTGEEIEPSRDD